MTHSNSSFRNNLYKWYQIHKRDLPWRNTSDPYAIWVSEVMLQQTRVDTVIDYYHRFLSRFPTVADLASATQESVLKIWEGLGYYARARNLHKAAQWLMKNMNGALPDTWEAFRALPGVGDYIAHAVLSIAYHQPYAVVDGNVKRVYARFYQLSEPVNQSQSHEVYQKAANRALFTSHPADWNQAIMELGALICTPTSPKCTLCPVSGECKSFLHHQVQKYPKRVDIAKVPTHHISIGVVHKNDKLLITRRKEEGLLGGLWEFPGGKQMKKETPQKACVREIYEECHLNVAVESHLARVKHAYTHFKVDIDVFVCKYVLGRVRLTSATAHKWVRSSELSKYPFPKANHLFMKKLLEYFAD